MLHADWECWPNCWTELLSFSEFYETPARQSDTYFGWTCFKSVALPILDFKVNTYYDIWEFKEIRWCLMNQTHFNILHVYLCVFLKRYVNPDKFGAKHFFIWKINLSVLSGGQTLVYYVDTASNILILYITWPISLKCLSNNKSCPVNTILFVFRQNPRNIKPIHFKNWMFDLLNYYEKSIYKNKL